MSSIAPYSVSLFTTLIREQLQVIMCFVQPSMAIIPGSQMVIIMVASALLD